MVTDSSMQIRRPDNYRNKLLIIIAVSVILHILFILFMPIIKRHYPGFTPVSMVREIARKIPTPLQRETVVREVEPIQTKAPELEIPKPKLPELILSKTPPAKNAFTPEPVRTIDFPAKMVELDQPADDMINYQYADMSLKRSTNEVSSNIKSVLGSIKISNAPPVTGGPTLETRYPKLPEGFDVRAFTKRFYPEEMQRRGRQATIKLVVAVDEEGRVSNPVIVEGSRWTEFDEAAKKCALALRYEPALQNGVPIKIPRFQITIIFELD